MKGRHIPEVLALIVAWCSGEASDANHTKEVQRSMRYCEKRVEKLTGLKPINFPAEIYDLISALKNESY